MKKSIFIFIFCVISENTLPQTNDEFIKNNLNLLTRYRLAVGFVELAGLNDDYRFKHAFFNISFRSSDFNKNSSSFGVGFAFEPGINGLIFDYEGEESFNFYFVPYAKVGPDFRLARNTFIAASAGLMMGTYQSIFIAPFFGINTFFIAPVNDNLNIEIEGGFHSTYSYADLPLLFYLTAGISFK